MMMALRNAFIIELPPSLFFHSRPSSAPPPWRKEKNNRKKKVEGKKKVETTDTIICIYPQRRATNEQRRESRRSDWSAIATAFACAFIIPWLFQVRRPIVSSGDAIFFFVFIFFFCFLPFSPLFPTALHCTKKSKHTHTHIII